MATTLLLSIHARYARQIFSGQKTVELRRVLPRIECGDKVLVYVTAPQMELLGEFTVKGLLHASPAAVWKAAGAAACVTREEYDCYFHHTANAVAIQIAHPKYFRRSIPLAQLRKIISGFHPPQVHRYISPSEYDRLVPTHGLAAA
jgi:predicted transcriptional regulator